MHYGKKTSLVYSRMGKGWSLEQALDLIEPPKTVKFIGKKLTVFGKSYASISAAATDLGISEEPFRLRLLKGFSPEEAFVKARKKR
jgi:hypothetical protein